MADAMVLATQKWLNEKYGNDSRFNKVAEDGITGWGTIYGLRRALQIEEKLPSLSNNFGQSTYAKCPTVKKGDTGNLVYIVQVDLMEYMEMEHTQQFNVLKKLQDLMMQMGILIKIL